ncbi:MAG: glycosyltransferase family 2 protein [Actinomycetes bacterium]
MDLSTDVLMISYNRPDALGRSLPRLLDTCDEHTRVWLWQNGSHPETLELARAYAADPRVARFHHSEENLRLTAPTNWLWENSRARFVGKVDDDFLVEPGWVQALRTMVDDWDGFGALGCWPFPAEDFVPELGEPRIGTFPGGHRVVCNHWVGGHGYLVRREHLARVGPVRDDLSFTAWCVRLARTGLVNGYPYPLVLMDNMDDPRSVHTLRRSEADLVGAMPLSAIRNGVKTFDEFAARAEREARVVLESSLDLRQYGGWRFLKSRLTRRARNLVTGRRDLW